MKRTNKAGATKKNFDEFVSILSEYQILDYNSMICVRGGEGDGGEDIIIMPPKPPKN